MRACLIAVVTACSYAPEVGTAPDDSTVGADTADGPPINANCFGTFGTVCLQTLPAAAFSVGATTSTVTTDNLASCEPVTNGTNVTGCVISGTSITIDGNLIGKGARPLILVATEGPLIVDKLVEVASHRDQNTRGAGSNPSGECTGATTPTGGAGGPGGSLTFEGGNGGGGFGGVATTPNAAKPQPTTLRGGCQGGLGSNAVGTGGGGNGGGAVWLVSKERITITGTVNASGAGGAGGIGDMFIDRGGSGGGAGGMIVLDAPLIEIDGVVIATGGAGGGGNTFADGDPGEDPDPANPDMAAQGGLGSSGVGGAGGVTGDGQDGGTNITETGCGGGGSTGHIRARGPVTGVGAVFPAITPEE